MGWFDEQIRQRKLLDEDAFEEALLHMSDAVLGSKEASTKSDDLRRSKDAIDEILKFYRIKSREVPPTIKDFNGQLEYLLRPDGIMRRTVNLEEGWHKDAVGAMLAQTRDGKVVALIPRGFAGYDYLDPDTGKRVRVNAKNEALFEREALCFYKPLPLGKLNIASLVRYMFSVLSTSDYAAVVIAALFVMLVGQLTPMVHSMLFSRIVHSGSMSLLLSMSICLLCITASQTVIASVRALLMNRINTKLDMSIQSATMMRVLSLPAAFFKEYSSGELASRTNYMNSLCRSIMDAVLGTGLTSLFSLAYIAQILLFAPTLVVPALIVILATVVVSVASALMQAKISKRRMELSAEENGLSYGLITGIQKIRLSGSEKRVFARWANHFAHAAELQYNPPMFLKVNGVITLAISTVGTIVIYAAAIQAGISTADYYAFNTAYGMVQGAFMQLAGIALTASQIRPILSMIKPVLEAEPEISHGKRVLDKLSGSIELDNVTFRYQENMPDVINNLSLKIRAGQYVAIVGTTGCGKSTLMRLMLGFETPQKGAIYFDGQDIAQVDLKSLRSRIGTVMQNGSLFSGDIYSNITISAPGLPQKDAWEAAEIAGIADDIRAMPMGMFTMISEGQGGISGGQKQRIMIARAVAPKPKILMFDEATSALDNITQKKVSDALDKLKCTRIVIAHRLSTIRHCDRIIVLDKGRIIEDGTYEQLIEHGGFFADLVERQRLDKE